LSIGTLSNFAGRMGDRNKLHCKKIVSNSLNKRRKVEGRGSEELGSVGGGLKSKSYFVIKLVQGGRGKLSPV